MGNIYKKIRGASALKKASALKQNGDNPNAINVFKVNAAGDYIRGEGSYDYKPGKPGSPGYPGSKEFQAAFGQASAAGLDEFEFNGKMYTTELATGGTDGTPDQFSYKTNYPGATTVKTVEETANPTTKDYNMGYYEARSAKLGAKQKDKIVNQRKRRSDKDIRIYEEGRKGFLGLIGKGKGKGELTENVVAAYEQQGKIDEDRFTYNQVENPNYVEGGTEPKMIRGNQITGEKGGDQIVSESMRTGANTLKLNKFSSPIGEKIVEGGGTTKTTTETISGSGKIAEGEIKNVKGRNYIEKDGKLFNFTTVDGKVVLGEEFVGKPPGYSTKDIAPFKMAGYGKKHKK